MHFDTPSNFVPAGQSARYQNKVDERILQLSERIWSNTCLKFIILFSLNSAFSGFSQKFSNLDCYLSIDLLL